MAYEYKGHKSGQSHKVREAQCSQVIIHKGIEVQRSQVTSHKVREAQR